MNTIIRPLLLLILTIQSVDAGDMDGRWQLEITGHDQLEFGTEHLAGGVRVDWQSVLDFFIEDGVFKQGTGTASLLPQINTVSRPEGMFECQQESGIFANNDGQSFSTPHLRYRAFPMLGEVKQANVRLYPHLDYPGNYYALLYRCKTGNALGSFWLENSPRIARELSKRQNAIVKVSDSTYSAKIKEVKTIAPGPELEIPLIDGLTFSVTRDYGLRTLKYQLRHIGPE